MQRLRAAFGRREPHELARPADEPAEGGGQLAAAPGAELIVDGASEPFVPAGVSMLVLPASVRGGLLDPRARGAMALAGLAVAAALVAGGVALRARPQATAVTPVGQPRVSLGPGPASPSAPAILVIEVAGAVRRPGLQRLPAGSRVADALVAAGGAKPGTSTLDLNLARKLVDGEQLAVGVPGRSAAPGAPAASGPGTASGVLNLNSATLSELDQLSGVGPVLAQRIIAWRDANGGFASIDQLREVEGIGERKFESLRPQVGV